MIQHLYTCTCIYSYSTTNYTAYKIHDSAIMSREFEIGIKLH